MSTRIVGTCSTCKGGLVARFTDSRVPDVIQCVNGCPTFRPAKERIAGCPDGRVMICPTCESACREHSPWYVMHDGNCPRCSVPFVPDTDGPRVNVRDRLYVLA